MRWLLLVLAACAGSSEPAPRAPAVRAPAPPAVRAEPSATPAPPAVRAEPSATPAPSPPAEPEPPCPGSERDAAQKPSYVVELLALARDMVVIDVGAGDGYFLCWLARAVGPGGRVIATEVSGRLVRALENRAARERLANVEVRRGPARAVGVDAGTADRVLFVNVWHHLAKRKRYAASVARVLAPDGKVVVIDFLPSKNGHGIAPRRVIAELAAGGIAASLLEIDELTRQYVVIGTPR